MRSFSIRFVSWPVVVVLACFCAFAFQAPAQVKKDKKDGDKKEEKKEEPKKEAFKPDTPLKELKGHGNSIQSLSFSEDGKLLVSGSRDRLVKIWDIGSGKDLTTLKGHPQDVKGAVFLPGGQVAASTASWNKEKKALEGEIKVWDPKGKEVRSLKGHTDFIEALAISSDGKRLASASKDQTIKIWDLAAAKDVLTLKHGDTVLGVAFSKDGKKLASASEDRTVKIWDAGSGKDLFTFKAPVKETKEVPKVAEPKKKDKKDKKDKDKTPAPVVKKEEGRAFTCVAFSPDGKKLAGGNLDGFVKVWDAQTGKELYELKAHEGVWALAFSPDGKKLATGGWDQTIKIWDENGKELKTIQAHLHTVSALAFSPDGKLLASGGLDNLIKIWTP